MVAGILRSMRWLGLDWDEGPGVGGPHAPYFQSERLERYRAAAQRLVETGHAYYCYCKPEVLKARRDEAQARGEIWIYDRVCRALSAADVAANEAAKLPVRSVQRCPKVARRSTIVHGRIESIRTPRFRHARSDGHPTYHLSVVVDDVDMAITHVVRGDDHVSNTPKQVLLYRAMGATEPAFAHVPLILGPDKKRLSKRHGATSVEEYEKDGILPEAMTNFLARSAGRGRATGNHSRDELVARFALEGTAAATPCSTRRSWPGSTSSTSCG